MNMVHIIKSYKYRVMSGRDVFDYGVVWADSRKSAKELVKGDVKNQTGMRVVIE